LATKRVHNIAKDLGINSKLIVEKCKAEGIPDSIISNHMSVVSAGLEATIREWFAEGSGTTTAVETAAKVEVEKARAKAPSRARKARAEGGEHHDEAHADEHHAGAAVIETAPESHTTHPPETRAHVETRPHAEPKPDPSPKPVHKPEPEAAPIDEHQKATPIEYKAEPPKPEPRPAPPKLAPTIVNPVAPVGPAPSKSEPVRPAASAPSAPARPGQTPPPGSARVSPTGGPPGSVPSRTGSNVTVNVPTRPTNVTPAGPKLEQRAAVKLAGPKVVRIEAPEQMEAPRPRRPGPGSGPSSPTGPRRGGGAGVAEDDSGRSPRRKGGNSGPATGAGAKRSSGQGVPQRRRASSGEVWVGGQVFSEQDIIEREARLLRAGGFLKKRKQDLKKGEPGQPGGIDEQDDGKVRIAAPFTIKDLSAATGVKGAEIVKKLFLQGVMATINSGIDPVKAQEIMMDFEIELEVVEAKSVEEQISESHETREYVDKRRRGPVVTILGHVDHGKTSLLDKIRNANVAAGEAGGITQKTSAFKVPLKVAGEEKEIVFLDTPGHEAFTSMRSRGANMTDIVVLVVSAPEGVMPQTIESINHARAAGVPIVVALNKIDRPDATDQQIRKVLGQLAEANLNTTEWGGDVEIVRTSANTGQGIPELLEVLDYQAQLLELTADFGGEARGTVIEARTQEGRGPVANLLIQDGHLAVGDFIVAGRAFGRVRDITDDKGNRIKEAYPPTPIQISGLDELPDAGDKFFVCDSLREAQEAADQRRTREREQQLAQPKVTLDSLFTNMADKAVKEILIVLKADAQGSVDVLRAECEKVKGLEVKTRVIHSAVGGITESDVLLAEASKAIVIGFNVIPSGKARSLAENKGVEIRTYDVIYNIMDDIKKAAEGLLAPELRQEILGHAEVRQVFKISKVGSIAGCYITDGTVQRDALIRVTRNNIVIENDRKLEQLKRFKDDAKEVRMGMECGMKIVGYDDIKEGDILECYKQVEVKRTL
jgi:translation initiation factor IF-2